MPTFELDVVNTNGGKRSNEDKRRPFPIGRGLFYCRAKERKRKEEEHELDRQIICSGKAIWEGYLEQPFVKDSDKTVKGMIMEPSLLLGRIFPFAAFVRYEMGEGLEKREDNFVDEVMKQAGK